MIPEEGINSLEDWEARWSAEGARISDEYGDTITPAEMRERITERSWKRAGAHPPEWYRENHAQPGPNGLARHSVVPGHCIGHGEGTWDLLVGEFT